jgi:hypothetical protein
VLRKRTNGTPTQTVSCNTKRDRNFDVFTTGIVMNVLNAMENSFVNMEDHAETAKYAIKVSVSMLDDHNGAENATEVD